MSGGAGPAIVVSILGGLLIGLGAWALTARHQSAAQRIAGYGMMRKPENPESGKSLIERALGDKQARQLERSPWMSRMRTDLEVADVSLPPEQLLALVALATVFVGWLLATTTDSPIAALLGLCVPFVARGVVKTLVNRQRRAFSDQLPDNLAVIASAMRAGQTFISALRSVLVDAPEPSRRELNRAVTDEALGTPLVEALSRVTERMRSDDFQHVAIVASLQRETGGNTAEVVDLVAKTVRERIEVRRMVRSLTAQGRLSGGVLSLMPIGLLVLISLINPQYVHPLFHTTMGLIGLGVAVVLVVVGTVAIRKIVDIKV
ncbi:MAG: type II secretion system F family protein [Solirubrobacteraceae bacterium]